MKIKTRIKSTLLCLFVFLSSLVGILVCLIFQNAFSVQAAQECGIVSKYLRIGTDITMQYVVAVPEGAQNVKMTFTLNGKTTEVSDYTQGDGVRTYSYGGVTPQYLGANVAAALYYDGEKQDENVSSVKDYLTQLIASSASDLGIGERQAVSMQTLAKDVLFYGAAAQVYTQTDTDAPVNAGVAAGTVWEDVSDRLSSAPAIAATGEKVFKNANVSFGNHLVPFATFTLPEGTELSEVSAVVAGRKVEPVLVDEETRLYKISYGGFSILDIDGSFDYVLTVGDKTGTLTFSVAKYIETMAEQSKNAAFVDFIKATYVYAQSAKEYKTLSDTLTPVDVILFTGQSNMVGRETEIYDAEIPEGMAYEYKFNTDELVAVTNPVGEDIGSNKTVETSSGSSLVPAFVQSYVQETGRKVIVVHVARGARSISYFAEGGEIYPIIEQKYLAALDYIAQSPDMDVSRRFYVMFQGESNTADGSFTTVQTAYLSENNGYMSFHNAVKENLGIQFGAILMTGKNTKDVPSGVYAIYDAQKRLAQENDDIIIGNMEQIGWWEEDMDKSVSDYTYYLADKVHYNAAALQRIGASAASNIAAWLGYGDPAKKGVDPVTWLADPYPYHTVTLQDMTFADGTTSKTLPVGITAVSEGALAAFSGVGEHAGESVSAFYDAEGRLYSMKEYFVGRKDVTLSPALYNDFIDKNGYGNLYLGDYNFASYAVYGYGMTTTKGAGAILDGHFARNVVVAPGVYQSDGTGTEASFRMQADATLNAGDTVCYLIRNSGENAFTVSLYLRSSGSDKTPTEEETVTVAPGETARVYLSVTKTTSTLTYFRMSDPSQTYSLDVCALKTETPAFTATIAGSGVTFADGSTSAQFVVGAELPVTVEEGLTFLGWRGEDGLIVSSEAFRMPKKDVTLVPAFNTDTYVTQGFGKLQFAYGANGRDSVVNYGAKATLYGYGYIGGELARVLSVTGKADATSSETTGTNASFRTQTWYNREKGTTYRFVLTLHNFGSEEVSFRVYLRSSGSDTSDVTYYDVTLAVGETETVAMEWTSTVQNNNLLTYFKLTSDATGALIGGYMYAEDPAARHITLADGLEYGGETALTLSVGTVLSVADITVPEGKTLIGFKDNYDNYYADSYTVGADDVTLYPVWAVETVTQGDGKLDFGVLIGNNGPEITTRSYWYNVDSANTTTIIEGEKARVFAVTRKDTPVNADNTGLDSSFRASTDYAPVDNSRIHTLVYTIGNLGASDFAVQIYLRASGSDTVENHALYSTTVVVPAGKTATAVLRTVMYNRVAAEGSEMLNYFKFVEQDGVTLPDSARLDVSVYGYTAAYGLASVEEGTFEDGSTTLLCKVGAALPTVRTKSGAAASHVAVGNLLYANGSFVMPEADVSVTAVDYTAVTSGSGALDWNAGSVQNSFGNSAASIVTAAAYRNGMVGTMLTVKPNASTTPTNFRTMTAYKSGNGAKYTFTYTFVNCGAEEITFTCWQVNSSNNTANMATSGEITLAAGETTTVMLETTKLGNTNAMCYYAWNSATDSAQMQLFVSTTVKQG